MGSLVFVLDPEDVKDVASFRQSDRVPGRQVESKWLKFIVLDSRARAAPGRSGASRSSREPDVLHVARCDRKEAEGAGAAAASSDPLQHRRTLGVLAGFAFGKKEYDQAARLQTEWATLAESGGAPAEAASAYYNLGNTLLEKGELLRRRTTTSSAATCVSSMRQRRAAPGAHKSRSDAVPPGAAGRGAREPACCPPELQGAKPQAREWHSFSTRWPASITPRAARPGGTGVAVGVRNLRRDYVRGVRRPPQVGRDDIRTSSSGSTTHRPPEPHAQPPAA